MMKRSFLITALLTLITTLTVATPTIDAAGSLIPDDALKEAINDELNEPASYEPTQADLQSLTSLTAVGKSISNLEGLQHAINITTLQLRQNKISDITPLENLTNLEYISLNNNQITNVSPLSSLNQLTTLHLSNNKDIRNINPLKNLNQLRTLGLSYNRQLEFAQLRNFTHLSTTLYLTHTGISDLSVLEDFSSLNNLYLNNNEISDLTPIKNLASLNLLNISNNQINNLSTISSVINSLATFVAKDQTIVLPEKELLFTETSLQIENQTTNQDGNIIDDIVLSNTGVYNSPHISWTGLTGSETSRTYTFDVDPNNNDAFSGTVVQPIRWNTSEEPTIHATDLTIYVGEDFKPLDHATATDPEDGDVTNSITIKKNDVDTRMTGQYDVTYEATDSDNQSVTKTITVTVKAPKTITIPFDIDTYVFGSQEGKIDQTNVIIHMPSDLPRWTLIHAKDKQNSPEANKAGSLKQAGEIIDFSLLYLEQHPSEPYTLIMPYDKTTYAANEVDIYYFDATKQKWIPQNGTVDENAGTITINPSHFSIYGVFAEVNNSTNGNDEDNGTGENTNNQDGTEDDDSDGKNNNGNDDNDSETSSTTTDGTDNDNATPSTDSKDTTKEGDLLPITSTSIYSWMLAGFLLFIAGFITLRIYRRSQSNS
ncbi:leucine-rich repeat domain-containing protein [Virgibacillus sp. W0430]|uniref:leucine-rich repeat domain-containing protein n=1 Tax=Virgibacillus sp. W0430 TaxID=3391580 RepID=UPI003F480D7A